jgi:hypothetical protein
MKIMPLGDSIVLGEGSSGGFREPLELSLQKENIEFEFIGRHSDNSYEMRYPFHEGWSRANITYLRDILELVMALAPDIVLLYAGTEDLKAVPNAGIASARYEKLVREIARIAPRSTIICSQLVASRDHSLHQKIKVFNTSLGVMTESIRASGANVVRLKMHAKVKDTGINDAGLLNELGYREMAAEWHRAIVDYYRRSQETVAPSVVE